MIAPERENTKTAEEIEVAAVVAVVEVLPASTPEGYIVADRPQHADHLLIEMAGMQGEAFGLVTVEQGRNINRHTRYVLALFRLSTAAKLAQGTWAAMRHSCRNAARNKH